MEKIPKNLNIGDQEFERVGEMKSEPTELKHAQEHYDLYKDTESGALMGDLDSIMDLTKLTQAEAASMLMADHNIDTNLRIYGKINKDKKGGELSVFTSPLVQEDDLFYERDIEQISRKVKQLSYDYRHEWTPVEIWDSILREFPHVTIDEKHITVAGKNSLLIGSEEGKDSAEVSFLEVPLKYKELMEEKEGKAE